MERSEWSSWYLKKKKKKKKKINTKKTLKHTNTSVVKIVIGIEESAWLSRRFAVIGLTPRQEPQDDACVKSDIISIRILYSFTESSDLNFAAYAMQGCVLRGVVGVYRGSESWIEADA